MALFRKKLLDRLVTMCKPGSYYLSWDEQDPVSTICLAKILSYPEPSEHRIKCSIDPKSVSLFLMSGHISISDGTRDYDYDYDYYSGNHGVGFRRFTGTYKFFDRVMDVVLFAREKWGVTDYRLNIKDEYVGKGVVEI